MKKVFTTYTGSACMMTLFYIYNKVTELNSHVEVLLHYCLNVFSWEESTNYNTVDRSTQRWNKRSPVTATDMSRFTPRNASSYFFKYWFIRSGPQCSQNYKSCSLFWNWWPYLSNIYVKLKATLCHFSTWKWQFWDHFYNSLTCDEENSTPAINTVHPAGLV